MSIDVVAQVTSDMAAETSAAKPVVTNPAATQPAPKAPVKEIASAQNNEENDGDQSDDGDDEEDVVFPKKAVNALSRRDKTIVKQKALIEQMQRRLEAGNQAAPVDPAKSGQTEQATGKTAEAPKEPNLDDFENLGDYLKAVARYEVQLERAEGDKQKATEADKQKQTEQTEATQRHYTQRTEYVAEKAKAYMAEIPGYEQLVIEHGDILDTAPPHIERLFLDAEDGALAFYNLAKEGKLEALLTMPIHQAAMEVGRAQYAPAGRQSSAATTTEQKKVTNAPAPVAASRGQGSSGRNAESMSGDELLKAIKKR